MSITGLLTNTPFLNSLHCKLHLAPKHKTEAITPQFVSLIDLPHPRSPLSSKIPHDYDSSSCSYQVAEDAVAECLSLLNQTNVNSHSTSNSSSSCKQVHGLLVKVGALKADPFVGNKLVVAYAKSLELFNEAQKLFDKIPKRSITSYAALISLYSRSEKWVDLFSVFGRMVNDGMFPDRYLLPTILKACSMVRVGEFGKMVHGYAIRRGLDEDIFVGNALIDMYTKCGALCSSKSVFDIMHVKDVVSWTNLIVAYLVHGFLDEAVGIFYRMEFDGVVADLISWNALISGFAEHGEIELALRKVEEMQRKGVKPQVTTWNGIITGCVQNEFYEDALDIYVDMLWTLLTPCVVTIVRILQACAGVKDLKLGKAIHGYAIKLGLCGNTHIGGSLIAMYWKCRRVDDAESIFFSIENKSTFLCNEIVAAYMSDGNVEPAHRLVDTMKDSGPAPDVITYNTMLAAYFRDGKIEGVLELLYEMFEMGLIPNVVTCNILIAGYQRAGCSLEALRIFHSMQSPDNGSFFSEMLKNSIEPNPVTVTSALAACADLGSVCHGKELHAYAVKNGLDSNIYVISALVDMYAKCSDMDLAIEVFWRADNKNNVTWNALIAAYVNRRQEREAFNLFDRMLKEGVEPTRATFMILIPACGEMGALRLGRAMYGYLLKNQFDELDNHLESPSIDMNDESGSMWEAQRVIDPKLLYKNKFKNDILMKYIHDTSFVPISGPQTQDTTDERNSS